MSDSDKVLSEAQRALFERDGFLVVPGFYGPGEMAEIAAWTEEATAWPEAPGRHMVYYEDSLIEPGKRVMQRLEDLTPFHPGFRRLYSEGRLQQAVSELLGEPVILFKDKINYKLPGGDGFKAHQDAQAGWDDYADFFVTALVSIDVATERNGCLEMAAGWHDRGLVGALWKPLDEQQTAGIRFVACPTEPGDAIFFDCYTPHRSSPNFTEEQRRVLYVTYNRASAGDQRARYFADKRKSFPPDIEREPGKSYVFRV